MPQITETEFAYDQNSEVKLLEDNYNDSPIKEINIEIEQQKHQHECLEQSQSPSMLSIGVQPTQTIKHALERKGVRFKLPGEKQRNWQEKAIRSNQIAHGVDQRLLNSHTKSK